MQNSMKIDCKISFENQIRRIIFTGNEFSSLKQQISHLFNIKSEFTLKYLDNESDLITLSSNDELWTALYYSDKILRLTIEMLPNTSSIPPASHSEVTCHSPVVPAPHHHHSDSEHCYRRCKGRGQQRRHSDKWQGKRVRLSIKIDTLKSWIAQYPNDASLTVQEVARKQQILAKIKCLEDRMNQWETRTQMKRMKRDCKMMRKSGEKKNLSPETLAQIREVKEQIQTLKPEKNQIKNEIRRLKRELDVSQDANKKGSCWEEIQVLKEKRANLKQQISPLKRKIWELKCQN
jgi:hypothetical protein